MKAQCPITVILLLFLATSCKKEDAANKRLQKLIHCQKYTHLNRSATFDLLLGEWEMIATACGECLSPGVKATEKNVRLLFTSDSTLRVFEDGKQVRDSKITISPTIDYVNTYSIETSTWSDNRYTWRYIQFCENTVGFISSYRDGIDYFFQRITNPKNSG